MAAVHNKLLSLLMIAVVTVLGAELVLQVIALIIANTVREASENWSTENTRVLALGDSNTFGLYVD